jgi:hypothetical protein
MSSPSGYSSSVNVDDFLTAGISDTAAIRLALAAASQLGGAAVVFANRTYVLSSTIALPSHIDIIGNEATITRPSGTKPFSFFRADGAEDIQITGFTFNWKGSEVISFKGITHAIAIENSHNVTVSESLFIDSKGLFIRGSDSISIIDNNFKDGDVGISVGGSLDDPISAMTTNLTITGNMISNMHSEAIDLNRDIDTALVSGNTLTGGVPWWSSQVNNDELLDIGGGVMKNITVVGNILNGAGTQPYGLHVKMGSNNVEVANNYIFGLTNTGPYGSGINIENSTNVSVHENVVVGALTGISGQGQLINVNIDNNTVLGSVVIGVNFARTAAGSTLTVENNNVTATGGGADVRTSAGNDTVTGSAGNDTLYGYLGGDTINGLEGNDKIFGEDGNDTLNGHSGADYLNGGEGNDIVDGGDGNDVLTGGSGNDVLYGGSGNDVIDSGSGDDRTVAGTGDDIITTGAGKDQVIVRSGDGRDVVQDFELGIDKIVFSDVHSASQIRTTVYFHAAYGAGTLISYGSNDSLFLAGVSQLSGSDILLNATGQSGQGGIIRAYATDTILGLKTAPNLESDIGNAKLGLTSLKATSTEADVLVQSFTDGSQSIKYSGEWNSLKTLSINDADGGKYQVSNFVVVDVDLKVNNSEIEIVDAKRGNVFTGNGSDVVAIEAKTNASSSSGGGSSANKFVINTGGGDDTISVVGAGGYSRVDIKAGEGNDKIVLADLAAGKVDGGAGSDFIDLGAQHRSMSVYLSYGQAEGDVIVNFNGGSAPENDKIFLSGYAFGASVDSLGDGKFVVVTEGGYAEHFRVSSDHPVYSLDFIFI